MHLGIFEQPMKIDFFSNLILLELENKVQYAFLADHLIFCRFLSPICIFKFAMFFKGEGHGENQEGNC